MICSDSAGRSCRAGCRPPASCAPCRSVRTRLDWRRASPSSGASTKPCIRCASSTTKICAGARLHSSIGVKVGTVLRESFLGGKRGELRQRYREGQEDQLGALGLVVNMIVLWNTIYMEAVLEQFRRESYPVNEEDKARLSPLIHEHINTQGRHSFVMPEAVVKGELRPLRNPAEIRTEAIT